MFRKTICFYTARKLTYQVLLNFYGASCVAYPKMYLYQNIFAQILKISILFKSLDCHVQRIKLNGDISLGGTEVESLSTVGTWPKRFTLLDLAKKTAEIRASFWDCCRLVCCWRRIICWMRKGASIIISHLIKTWRNGATGGFQNYKSQVKLTGRN